MLIILFCMLFGNRSVDIDAPNFVLSNVQIEAKSTSGFLGIFWATKFKFNHHITFISDKVFKTISILYKLQVTCLFLV